MNQGNYQEAINDFTLAISHSKEPARALINRGSSYRSLKMYDQALADFQSLSAMGILKIKTANNLGLTYADLGRNQQALEQYNFILERRPNYIPALVNRFLEKYNALHGKRISGISEKALNALMGYDWPGNIRELENMIERGVIIASNDTVIDLPNLFPSVAMESQVSATGLQKNDSDSELKVTPTMEMEQLIECVLDNSIGVSILEHQLLTRAVERTKGNLSSAARLLGISRPQLAYRLKKYVDTDYAEKPR
jgi:tetratricopeptide (TPR) repeat protein